MKFSMRSSCVGLLIVPFALAANAETVTISEVIPFAENSGASTNVKSECKLETRIPEYIAKAAKGDISIDTTGEDLDAVEGPVMFVTIAHVYAPGGGNWSGGKSVRVDVAVSVNGRVVEETTIQRSSRVGFGTCAILKKISRVLGEDIVAWLGQALRKSSLPQH